MKNMTEDLKLLSKAMLVTQGFMSMINALIESKDYEGLDEVALELSEICKKYLTGK